MYQGCRSDVRIFIFYFFWGGGVLRFIRCIWIPPSFCSVSFNVTLPGERHGVSSLREGEAGCQLNFFFFFPSSSKGGRYKGAKKKKKIQWVLCFRKRMSASRMAEDARPAENHSEGSFLFLFLHLFILISKVSKWKLFDWGLQEL